MHRTWAWMAVHSDRDVGFESGKMMGWSVLLFISLRISSLNRPPHADRPIIMVGFTCNKTLHYWR